MGIKTVPQPPHSRDLAPCDFCLFPKLRGCRYETIEEMKEAVTRGLPWGLPEVVGTVQEVHCSQRRLLRRGLEFHVSSIYKYSKLPNQYKHTHIYIYIYIYIYVCVYVCMYEREDNSCC